MLLLALSSLLLGVDAGAPAKPVDFADDVKLLFQVVTCQGGALPENLDGKTVAAYCASMTPKFDRFKDHWGGPQVKAFLAALVQPGLPGELVYPFGGGDLMMALATFPDAKVVTTLSLELAGDPRRLRTLKDTAALKQSLAGINAAAHTTLLSNDSKSVNLSKIQRGELPGQLSMHLMGLALHGYVPTGMRYFRVEDDGTLHYFSQEEIDALDGTMAKNLRSTWKSPDFSPAFANVEVTFVPKDQPTAPPRIHRHIAADLSNDGLAKVPGVLKHLERKGRVAMMTKAASYLLWRAEFSTMRDYLVANAEFMISDSTGVLPKAWKKAGCVVETWGSFHQSFLNTGAVNQAQLVEEYQAQPKRHLPFRFGYPDGSPEKRNHLVVVRRPQADGGVWLPPAPPRSGKEPSGAKAEAKDAGPVESKATPRLFPGDAGSPAPAAAAPTRCAPVAVSVDPVSGTGFRAYAGRTATHHILFVSERSGALVDAFPEPPVRIIRRSTGAACDIREGGVWARAGVYVGAGGRRLVLLETSGSSAALVIYDPNSCARLGQVDVSEARWRFVDAGVDIGRDCTGTTIDGCRTRVTARLGSDCAVAGN